MHGLSSQQNRQYILLTREAEYLDNRGEKEKANKVRHVRDTGFPKEIKPVHVGKFND